jgi:hypothetical protein
MKLMGFLLYFCFGISFSQVQQSETTSKNNPIKNTVYQYFTGDLNWKTEINSENGDTIQTGFDEKNYPKEIIITNAKKGISQKQFHSYAKSLNSSFKMTHSFKDSFSDYFYDTNSKHLISKKFSSDKKTKITTLYFLWDFATITNNFPHLKNL